MSRRQSLPQSPSEEDAGGRSRRGRPRWVAVADDAPERNAAAVTTDRPRASFSAWGRRESNRATDPRRRSSDSHSDHRRTRRRSTWGGAQPQRTRVPHNLYHKIEITGDDGGLDMPFCCRKIVEALECRERFQSNMWEAVPNEEDESVHQEDLFFQMEDGVVFYEGQQEEFQPCTYEDYALDFQCVLKAVLCPKAATVCGNRLKILDEKYKMYRALNADLEEGHCPFRKGGGVFAKCVKVDNSVRLTTAMHAQDLLDFIVEKHAKDPDTECSKGQDGKPVTLGDVFRKHKITDPQELTVEGVGLHPPAQKRFHRFDIFSEKNNRGGKQSAELLKIFLKRDGPFYADIVRPILERNDEKFDHDRVATEYKLPIFGLDQDEWRKLAKWVYENKLGHKRANRWIIQIPRVVELRKIYKCQTMQEQLDNIFIPIWKATVSPEGEKNKEVARLLCEVGSFNIITDETARGQELPQGRVPVDWKWAENPPDLYFNYYMWANICSLNYLRRKKGLNCFQFRPNCGEKGKIDHLVGGFILADAINHGVMLQENPVLQYLYYMTQVGIAFSPLANNGLDNPRYDENPFQRFQRMGFKVSLSTDDPLHYHHSRSPCIEEYGTAQKLYRLGPVDLTEIARNSVLISGYSEEVKQQWLGPDFRQGVQGNDHLRSNVPFIRLLFREDTLYHEQELLNKVLEQQECEMLVSKVAQRNHLAGVDQQQHMNLQEVEQGINFPRVSVVDPVLSHSEAQRGSQATAARELAKCVRLRRLYIWQHPKQPWERFESVEKDGETNYQMKGDDNDDWGKGTSGYEYQMIKGVIRWRRKPGAPPTCTAETFSKQLHTKPDDDSTVMSPAGDGWVPDLKEFPDLDTYKGHLDFLNRTMDDVNVKTLCNQRLQVLEHKFNLHMALNAQAETRSAQGDDEQTRDFYQATKVDTHIHAAAGMTARQLLDFIRDKARNNPDDVVRLRKDNEPETLRQLFRQLNVEPDKLTVDHLNVHADLGRGTMFDRFDNFNASYNPMGNADLRSLLLKTDNWMGGRYFAEIIKSSFAQYQRDKFSFAEMRLSIYGRSDKEWERLAEWFDTHGMANYHNKWMIQVPRLYHMFKKTGAFESFGDMMRNIFNPLWEASLHPGKHPKLHHLLRHMSGFDSVDNENTPDIEMPVDVEATKAAAAAAAASGTEPKVHLIYPDDYKRPENPPYSYWMYTMWANIKSLNTFRSKRGMSTFHFRPHCGESGSPDHLVHCFLTADGINHGINLCADPGLEYLYYLAQIGIAVSPLSNNSLFLDYLKNPFPGFFRRGLNVSLSTDDPLQFHHTQEPLIEEYSCASKVWKLGPNDMCEIARNSVLQSGFDEAFKASVLGPLFFLSSSKGNFSDKTNLSDIRVAYRFETFHSEINYLKHITSNQHFRGGTRAKMRVADETAVLRKLNLLPEDAQVPGSDGEEAHSPTDNRVRLSDLQRRNDRLRGALNDVTRMVSDAERVLRQTAMEALPPGTLPELTDIPFEAQPCPQAQDPAQLLIPNCPIPAVPSVTNGQTQALTGPLSVLLGSQSATLPVDTDMLGRIAHLQQLPALEREKAAQRELALTSPEASGLASAHSPQAWNNTSAGGTSWGTGGASSGVAATVQLPTAVRADGGPPTLPPVVAEPPGLQDAGDDCVSSASADQDVHAKPSLLFKNQHAHTLPPEQQVWWGAHAGGDMVSMVGGGNLHTVYHHALQHVDGSPRNGGEFDPYYQHHHHHHHHMFSHYPQDSLQGQQWMGLQQQHIQQQQQMQQQQMQQQQMQQQQMQQQQMQQQMQQQHFYQQELAQQQQQFQQFQPAQPPGPCPPQMHHVRHHYDHQACQGAREPPQRLTIPQIHMPGGAEEPQGEEQPESLHDPSKMSRNAPQHHPQPPVQGYGGFQGRPGQGTRPSAVSAADSLAGGASWDPMMATYSSGLAVTHSTMRRNTSDYLLAAYGGGDYGGVPLQGTAAHVAWAGNNDMQQHQGPVPMHWTASSGSVQGQPSSRPAPRRFSQLQQYRILNPRDEWVQPPPVPGELQAPPQPGTD